jgi:hypothetical protein
MNIYDIKRLTADTEPYFFSDAWLYQYGQKMEDFTVTPQPDGRYKIHAPIYNARPLFGHECPFTETVRYYNPTSHRLEME